jgi:hypothetical protein
MLFCLFSECGSAADCELDLYDYFSGGDQEESEVWPAKTGLIPMLQVCVLTLTIKPRIDKYP